MRFDRILDRAKWVACQRYRSAGIVKFLTLTLAGVAFASGPIPVWASGSVLSLNILQTALAVYLCASRRSLPKTYLQCITFGAFLLGLRLNYPYSQLAFGLGVLATVNHVAYYTIMSIRPEARQKLAISFSQKYLSLPYLGGRFRPKHLPSSENHFLTVSNLVTSIRGLLIIPMVSGILADSLAWMFWGAMFWLLDLLDGSLARRWNQVTSFGKTLDPIVDKFALTSVLLALWLAGRVQDWLMATTAARVIIVSLVAWVMMESRYTSRPRSYFGAAGNIFLTVAAYGTTSHLFEALSAACSLQLIIHYPYQAFRIMNDDPGRYVQAHVVGEISP